MSNKIEITQVSIATVLNLKLEYNLMGRPIKLKLTHRKMAWLVILVQYSGRTLRQFVPIGKILKPVLNECVTPVTCYWSLSVILRGEEQLLQVFKVRVLYYYLVVCSKVSACLRISNYLNQSLPAGLLVTMRVFSINYKWLYSSKIACKSKLQCFPFKCSYLN